MSWVELDELGSANVCTLFITNYKCGRTKNIKYVGCVFLGEQRTARFALSQVMPCVIDAANAGNEAPRLGDLSIPQVSQNSARKYQLVHGQWCPVPRYNRSHMPVTETGVSRVLQGVNGNIYMPLG